MKEHYDKYVEHAALFFNEFTYKRCKIRGRGISMLISMAGTEMFATFYEKKLPISTESVAAQHESVSIFSASRRLSGCLVGCCWSWLSLDKTKRHHHHHRPSISNSVTNLNGRKIHQKKQKGCMMTTSHCSLLFSTHFFVCIFIRLWLHFFLIVQVILECINGQ